MQADVLNQPEQLPLAPERQHSVLIIDDDDSISEVLAYRLSQQGYLTATAGRGELGIAMARDGQPDLILLDLRLPDIDGFSVCRRLDEDPQTSHIPVIILSGMERPDIIRTSRVAGCTFFVRKPYDPNALLILVQQAIRESESL